MILKSVKSLISKILAMCKEFDSGEPLPVGIWESSLFSFLVWFICVSATFLASGHVLSLWLKGLEPMDL
jgi:hypothetical protein